MSVSSVARRCSGLCFLVPFGSAETKGAHFLDFGLGEMLDSDEIILSAARPDQFVKFGLYGRSIPILYVLNQEYHEEGDDRSAGVDNELPRLGVLKPRPQGGPQDNGGDAEGESPRSSGGAGDGPGHSGERSFQ